MTKNKNLPQIITFPCWTYYVRNTQHVCPTWSNTQLGTCHKMSWFWFDLSLRPENSATIHNTKDQNTKMYIWKGKPYFKIFVQQVFFFLFLAPPKALIYIDTMKQSTDSLWLFFKDNLNISKLLSFATNLTHCETNQLKTYSWKPSCASTVV